MSTSKHPTERTRVGKGELRDAAAGLEVAATVTAGAGVAELADGAAKVGAAATMDATAEALEERAK